MRVDKEELDKIINQVLKTRAEKFLDLSNPDLRKYGLDKPFARWEIWVGEANAYRSFMIGKKASNEDAGGSFNAHYYAKDEGRSTIFTIDTVLVTTMDVEFTTLRDKKVARYSRDDVTGITFDYGDSSIVFEKDSSGSWDIVSPIKGDAKGWKVNGALTDLEIIDAEEFLKYAENSRAQFGFTKPALTIILGGEEKEVGRYLFGRKKGESIYLLDENRQKMYLVPAESLDNFKFTSEEMAEKTEQTSSTEG